MREINSVNNGGNNQFIGPIGAHPNSQTSVYIPSIYPGLPGTYPEPSLPWSPPLVPFIPQVSSGTIIISNIVFCKFMEIDGKFVLEVEMPGTKKVDVSVSVEGNFLNLSWTDRKALTQCRTVDIPELANKKSITARLEDGILTVLAAKSPKPKSAARTIKVE